MSDNRTAEEFLNDVLGLKYTLSIQMGAEIKLTPTEITYMVKEYASQQTASLREERDKLQEAFNVASDGWHRNREEKNRLQEEVERLRGLLGDVLAAYEQYGELTYRIVDELRKALSSKESKPS